MVVVVCHIPTTEPILWLAPDGCENTKLWKYGQTSLVCLQCGPKRLQLAHRRIERASESVLKGIYYGLREHERNVMGRM